MNEPFGLIWYFKLEVSFLTFWKDPNVLTFSYNYVYLLHNLTYFRQNSAWSISYKFFWLHNLLSQSRMETKRGTHRAGIRCLNISRGVFHNNYYLCTLLITINLKFPFFCIRHYCLDNWFRNTKVENLRLVTYLTWFWCFSL